MVVATACGTDVAVAVAVACGASVAVAVGSGVFVAVGDSVAATVNVAVGNDASTALVEVADALAAADAVAVDVAVDSIVAVATGTTSETWETTASNVAASAELAASCCANPPQAPIVAATDKPAINAFERVDTLLFVLPLADLVDLAAVIRSVVFDSLVMFSLLSIRVILFAS